MKNEKKLTILHSNDLHGDFLPDMSGKFPVGGVALLSGYVGKVRREEENVIYTISGDMFRGSVIDEEYRGMSTVEIINRLAPDVVTIGNHELDYGVPHLLFIDKCAKFPIINSNMRIKPNGIHLFMPYTVIERDGIRILFIGIITEDVLAQTKQDPIIGNMLEISDAVEEIGKICTVNESVGAVDLTVLLTHIGIEADKKLAAALDPAWGVDVILGGHSHTFMSEPVTVNDILIAHAGTGTDIIGRFNFVIDTDKAAVKSYEWRCVPVTGENIMRDHEIEKTVEAYKAATDRKYERIVTKFNGSFTHPVRNAETELGNLFADVFCEALDLDVMLLGSGSIRSDELGPTVAYGGLTEAFPFDDGVYMFRATGELFKRMMLYMLREEAFVGHTEFYQLSRGMKLVYSRKEKCFREFSYFGREIKDTDVFKIGMQTYHFTNIEAFLNVTYAEIGAIEKPRIVAVSCIDVLDDYLSAHGALDGSVEGRIVIE